MPHGASPFQQVPNTPSFMEGKPAYSEVPVVPEMCNTLLKTKHETPNISATVPTTPNPSSTPMEPPTKDVQLNMNLPMFETANVSVFMRTQEQRVPSSPITNAGSTGRNPLVLFTISKKKDRASIKRRRVFLLSDAPTKTKMKMLKPLFSEDENIFG